MPIEIRELVIKVTVHDQSRQAAQTAAVFSAEERERLRKELTESCLREVLATLEKRLER